MADQTNLPSGFVADPIGQRFGIALSKKGATGAELLAAVAEMQAARKATQEEQS